ncbi:hypothetical protein [Streptomyces glomeratus]|uniref:Uncharacterized protein n=1 Tax=Streptomyces glomeratus TaxID=284452 RepID=A0ABP6L534_9ACTN|nr:hypothetical protein [Streptomyces glomeratus]MCF1512637.1 hypothetical protein [Streptomyces glomeratus]
MTEERQRAGDLVLDTQSNKLGYVMGQEGLYVQLRPVAGGREWDADPARVRPATNDERRRALEERNRALNAASSGGIFG